MYKEFKMEYTDNPFAEDEWTSKAWIATVDGEVVTIIDGTDEVWFTLFTAMGIPETFHSRLREYKNLLGRISYHNADDSGGEWKLVPSIKDEVRTLSDKLIDEDGKLESVIHNLDKGELL